MFEGLYYCNTHNDKVHCDYIVDGVYFTFTFVAADGRVYEHNEELDRIKAEEKQ